MNSMRIVSLIVRVTSDKFLEGSHPDEIVQNETDDFTKIIVNTIFFFNDPAVQHEQNLIENKDTHEKSESSRSRGIVEKNEIRTNIWVMKTQQCECLDVPSYDLFAVNVISLVVNDLGFLMTQKGLFFVFSLVSWIEFYLFNFLFKQFFKFRVLNNNSSR